MAKHAAKNRIDRLEELKGLLKEREHVTAGELAGELEVSLRTLNRDLRILRDAGLPIEADRGRGGGLRLHKNWSVGRLHLNVEEAVDLLLSMAIAERLQSPILLRRLSSVRRKIVASLGEAYQARIRQLRKRILVGTPASADVLASYASPAQSTLPATVDGFFNLRCLKIAYVDGSGRRTEREIEPQFLYFSPPVWYLLAFDTLRNDVRYFRADRILKVATLTTTFRPADPGPYLAAAEEGIAGI